MKKHTIQILMDLSSTHNFLDLASAKRVNYDLKGIPHMQVFVVSGHKLNSTAISKGFTWTLHGEAYQVDMVVVPLGSCEMILGVPWLTTLGPILWDFEKLRMEFTYKGKMQVLKGIHNTVV